MVIYEDLEERERVKPMSKQRETEPFTGTMIRHANSCPVVPEFIRPTIDEMRGGSDRKPRKCGWSSEWYEHYIY